MTAPELAPAGEAPPIAAPDAAAAAAWALLGAALLDFFEGDAAAWIAFRYDDGDGDQKVPLRHFFREPVTFSELERTALGLCRGRVLDVGAGSGCHSLELQALGLSPCAMDVAPGAVRVMRARGVRHVQLGDVTVFRGGPFDTVLMLMNGAGLVGRMAGIGPFLGHARTLLAPRGELLLNGRPSHPDRASGERRCRIEYRDRKGPPFARLFLAAETLAREASRAGWFCQVVFEEEGGGYLARLAPLP